MIVFFANACSMSHPVGVILQTVITVLRITSPAIPFKFGLCIVTAFTRCVPPGAKATVDNRVDRLKLFSSTMDPGLCLKVRRV